MSCGFCAWVGSRGCARGMRPTSDGFLGGLGLVPRRSDGGVQVAGEEAVCATETSIQAF